MTKNVLKMSLAVSTVSKLLRLVNFSDSERGILGQVGSFILLVHI